MLVYVAGLTVVAKRPAPTPAGWCRCSSRASRSSTRSFILIVWPSFVTLAAVAALGFPLTLVLQRWVPGD